MNWKWQWLIVVLASTLPYLAVLFAGWLYLYQNGWLLWWLLGTVLVSVASWPLALWIQRRGTLGAAGLDDVEASRYWTRTGTAAWNEVERIAAESAQRDLPLDRPEPAWEVLREVLQVVAQKFHPKSRQPLLEIPVPQILQIAELVARDLRNAFTENVPASHILTVNDLQRLQRLARMAPTLYRFYRIAMVAVNPASALARELNSYVQGRMVNLSAQDTKRWAVQFAIKKAGYYAIELYSGHLVLQDIAPTPYTTPDTQKALAHETKRDAMLQEEPLRILVLGQVKAGKSSLVNALFGETRAAVDAVPRTKHVDPYLLERDGLSRAIILDTAGYADAKLASESLADLRLEILRCDLILMACAANNAAREADQQLLTELRSLFQQDPDREFPPLVLALTKIDQLRPPREWNPPYDVAAPNGPKAESIRDALEAVAADLQVDTNQVVPVCLAQDKLYNIEEGLVPAIVMSLDAAHRLKYLRCLREYRDEEYWDRLWQQAGNTGRIMLKAGFHVLGEAGRKLDALNRTLTKKKS